MSNTSIRIVFALSAALALAACTTQNPNAAPMVGSADIGANTAPRGTPEFCRRYAAQTATNTYGTNSDVGADSGAEQQSRISGDAAYRRCLAGRTS